MYFLLLILGSLVLGTASFLLLPYPYSLGLSLVLGAVWGILVGELNNN